MPKHECSICQRFSETKKNLPQNKGALIRHLKGEKPKGHGLSLEEARELAREIMGF